MSAFDQFIRQQYLNLETFRKNGTGVKTPVWFVQDGDTLIVETVINSGKVKRIRTNGNVNVAPCKVDGKLIGDWVPAFAREIADLKTDVKAEQLFDKKYGLMRKMFGWTGVLQGRKNTILEITQREEH